MRGYRNFLIAVSAAFLVFSAFYGYGYDKLEQDYEAVGRYSYGASSAAEYAGQEAEKAGIKAGQERIHEIVRPVSVIYYVACLLFFVAAAIHSAWRKLSVLGVVACLVMTLWSLMLDGGVSFDEVYPAWIAAAIVIVVLQLVVLARPPAPVLAGAAA